jgi:hypothetical protein
VVVDSHSPSKKLSLLSVPLGWYVNINDSHGNLHSFSVQKTLDNVDSNFILQSVTGSKNKAVISWSALRGSGLGNFVSNTTLEVGKKCLIPQVFDGDPLGVITSFEVSPKPSVTSSHSKLKVYKLDISMLSPLVFGSGSHKPIITLRFDTDQEVDEYVKILEGIKKGWFAFHLKRIVKALKFNVIDGYGKNVYLQDIFDSNQGKKKAPADAQESLDWLENFLRVIVMNVVTSRKIKGSYVDSPKLQSMMIKAISDYIKPFLPVVAAPAAAAAKKPSSAKSPIIKEYISQRVMDKFFD